MINGGMEAEQRELGESLVKSEKITETPCHEHV